jgi:hypothetical protein
MKAETKRAMEDVLVAIEELLSIRRAELRDMEGECDRLSAASRGQTEPWAFRMETTSRFKRDRIDPLADLITKANRLLDAEPEEK